MVHRILIAEDNPDLRQIVADLLDSVGFVTLLAADGEEALRLIFKEKPDLVILDLSMPKVSGWDVAQRLRQDAAFATLPIIAFTAHALKGDEEKARAAGCSGYVSKPFSPEKLLETVGRFLKPKSS